LSEKYQLSAVSSGRQKLRVGLLAGAALLPVVSMTLTAQTARAQTVISGPTGSQIWSSGDFSVTSTGSISGGTTGVAATPAGGNLSNSGSIQGLYQGIGNTGAIGGLVNIGGIGGGYADISNATGATISQLTNSAAGSLSGGYAGVSNAGGISVLSNSGAISSTSGVGVLNTGNIGTLNNLSGGSIATGGTGVFNAGGSIGTLSNNGKIQGNYTGIFNAGGDINALTNNGQIIGGTGAGLYNSGTIEQLTNAAGASLTGAAAGLSNVGSVTALSNGGAISGYTGINNVAGIGMLSNNGSISGTGAAGVSNALTGAISQLTNAAGGSITGAATGIANTNATISALSNSGSIAGTAKAGISNSSGGMISQVTNAAGGSITGAATGIANTNATISALSNSGSITGTAKSGISNSSGGMIGQVTNAAGGSITGGATGVANNGGTITALTNNGKITGGTYGVNNAAGSTLTNLVNTGTISGTTAVLLNGTGTTLVNSGIIASTAGASGNAIVLGGVNNLVFTTGSSITGNIQGGGTASSISLQGTGSLTSNIVNMAPGTVQVASGANWSAEGAWSVGSVVNNGIFEPGAIGSTIGTPLSLTGNYVQNAGGRMIVAVTPQASSVFNISGNAALNGNVTYQFAPGTYTPKTYKFLTANAISGTFSSETYNNGATNLSGLPESTVYSVDPAVSLMISSGVVAPADDSIFSDTAQAQAQDTQATNSQLLSRAQQGGPSNQPCGGETPAAAADTAPGGQGQASRLADALGTAFCRAGGWIEATGSLMNAGSGNGVPGYNANTAGFLAGIDKQLTNEGARLGIAVGYDETFLRDRIGGGSSTNNVHVALYGAQPIGRVTLSGVISYGHAGTTTSRASGVAGVQGSPDANIYSGAAQASTQLDLGRVTLVPAAGLLVAGVVGNSFAETAPAGSSAYAVSGNGASYTSVRPYVTLQAGHSFTTSSDVLVSARALVGYEYEAADTGKATTLYAADGTGFTSGYIKLAPSNALLSAGVTAGKNRWSVYADYVAYVAGNWTAQTGQFGVRVKF
jgi:uncharacterized protein with beta-barrel porin domain